MGSFFRPEIPGSLVSEPKHRDSRFKSRPGTGLGIEIQSVEDSESVSEPKLRHSKYRNRNRNRKSDIPGLGIGTGIEFLMIMESDLEPESGLIFWNRLTQIESKFYEFLFCESYQHSKEEVFYLLQLTLFWFMCTASIRDCGFKGLRCVANPFWLKISPFQSPLAFTRPQFLSNSNW